MMRIMNAILVFNSGSTSLKFSLYHCPAKNLSINEPPQIKGLVELKNKTYQLTLKAEAGETVYPLTGKSLKEAVFHIKEYLNFNDVKAVGHRIVHGGDFFTSPIILNQEIIKKIQSLSSLAPLHNPMNVEGINIAKKLFPKIPQIAVFDTAFHSRMPLHSKVYPIPLKWYDAGIKRYGFHGINHQYCMEKVSNLLNKDIKKKKLITCHLGGGASLAAITNGRSIDTTMGFTPLEGLMMATRSGSIDPGILLHFLETKKMTLAALKRCLNDESGLLGISHSSDMREILQAKANGDKNATLAVDLYVHILSKGISSMAASLGGIDLLAFSGGIGENSAEIRERVCHALSFLNVDVDSKKNETSRIDEEISLNKSKVRVFRIQANEEWLIAKETLKLIS